MKYLLAIIMIFTSFNINASIEKFYQELMINNAQKAYTSAKNMTIALEENNTKPYAEFEELISNWKQVEALYILSYLDDKYIESPWYIDIFHSNNSKKLHADLDRIINNNTDIEIALYKNSYKTINALEYLIYKNNLKDKRVKSIAIIISKNLEKNLNDIFLGYVTNKDKIVANPKVANSYIMSALVDSSYKLKEWRIADVAGLSKKYKNKPNNNRAEYYISNNSILAMKAILLAHKNALDSKKYKSFGDFAKEYGATKEINIAIQLIDESTLALEDVKENDLTSSEAIELYYKVASLQEAYYISIMNKLGFISKILEADGD